MRAFAIICIVLSALAILGDIKFLRDKQESNLLVDIAFLICAVNLLLLR